MPGRVELELGCRRARDHDRLAERDDDEELKPLREVRGLDLPGRRRQLRPPRHPVEEERRRVVDRERDEPERHLHRVGGQRTGDPEDARGQEPDEDVQRRRALRRAGIRDDEGEEGVPPELDRDVRTGEEQRPAPERSRDRDRHHEAGEHDRQHEQPHRDGVGVELVRDPGRVVPCPPGDEEDEQRPPRSAARSGRGAAGARPA